MLFNLFFIARNGFTVSNSVWAVSLIYCLIAFLPNIYGVGISLDPSWTYGLSYAALQHLVFGKDIIFTYGPFGYLISGAAVEQNFFYIYLFRLLIHISFFTAVFFQIIQCKTLLQKIALFSATLFLSCLNVQTEYQTVLLALFIALNNQLWQSKHLRKWSLCLGCFSGLALLTKFTIGISTFTIFFICLSVSCYRAIEHKHLIKRHVFAIADFLLATASTLIVFLYPDFRQGFLTIFLCLAIAGCLSLAVGAASSFGLYSFLAKLGFQSSKHLDDLERRGISNHKLISESSFYLLYGLGLAVTALYFSPAIITYLQGSLEISSGYSSAMGIVGSGVELGCALFIILLTLLLVGTSFKLEDFAISLCLCWILFLIFKHGFVRADGHVIIFASLAPFLVALCCIRATRRAAQTRCFWGYLCTLTVVVFGFSTNNIGLPGTRLTQALAPHFVLSRLVEWSNPIQYKTKIAQTSDTQLLKAKFPTELRKLIGDRSVDIVPSEISLVAANHLNWNPRPVFQSYVAYTQFLDNINFDSLSKRDRDYIIYSFTTIDGRHPFFDEPKAFFSLFCNYQLLSKFPANSTQIPNTEFVLLEKRSTNICLPGTVQPPESLEWKVNKALKTDGAAVVRASFRFKYSLLGKLYKTLFRSAPVELWVNYVDGSRRAYRMVLDNANNGIMISHLPRSEQEAFSLFNNALSAQVNSFSLHTNNPLIYQKNVELRLASYRQSVNFSAPPSFVNLAQLKEVNFLPTTAAGTVGSFDFLQASRSKKTLSLNGWVARKGQETSDPVWLLITDGIKNKPLGMVRTGGHRPDVAKFLREPSYASSGWAGTLNASELDPGKHVVKVWFFDPGTNSALLMGSKAVTVN